MRKQWIGVIVAVIATFGASPGPAAAVGGTTGRFLWVDVVPEIPEDSFAFVEALELTRASSDPGDAGTSSYERACVTIYVGHSHEYGCGPADVEIDQTLERGVVSGRIATTAVACDVNRVCSPGVPSSTSFSTSMYSGLAHGPLPWTYCKLAGAGLGVGAHAGIETYASTVMIVSDVFGVFERNAGGRMVGGCLGYVVQIPS